MAQHIRELELDLPDKNVDRLIADVANRFALIVKYNQPSVYPPFPMHRLQDLGRGVLDPESDLDMRFLLNIFLQLPRLEALSVFTQQCPFPQSGLVLCRFLKYMTDSYITLSDFQDHESTIIQHWSISDATRSFKTPVRRLSFDFIPFNVFEKLHDTAKKKQMELSNTDIVNHFKGSLSELRDLHIVIAIDSLGGGYLPSLKYANSALSH